ncbi:hypothetical protein HDU93_004580, partial [Gonapodya sp. JEL0774]
RSSWPVVVPAARKDQIREFLGLFEDGQPYVPGVSARLQLLAARYQRTARTMKEWRKCQPDQLEDVTRGPRRILPEEVAEEMYDWMGEDLTRTQAGAAEWLQVTYDIRLTQQSVSNIIKRLDIQRART